jgi:hypothetical protein
MNDFSPRAVAWLVGLCGVSLVVALVLGVIGGNPGGHAAVSADGRSVSAIGHRAFLDLLRKLEIPVVVSEYETDQRASESTVVVVAEPQLDDGEACGRLSRIVAKDGPVLVILPKWRPTLDPSRPDYAGEVDPVAADRIQAILTCLDLGWSVVHPAGAYVSIRGATVQEPQLVVTEPGAAPVLLNPANDHKLVVLADPDPIENHGLDDGDNAAFAVGLVEELRPAGGVVVYDETLHGHVRVPSLWRELFTFPWSLVTASGLFALAALLFARTRRFGAPAPAQPAIAPGKLFLIDNTAALLAYGGHAAHALERYLAVAVADVTAKNRPPSRELSNLPNLKELEADVRDVARHPARALAVADRIHRWRQEMLDGSASPRRA